MTLLPDDEEFLRRYVAQAKWREATTMRDTPHEYVLRKDDPYPLDMIRFASIIRTHGYPERFFRRTFTYLALDGWKYWTMDADLADTTLINRCRVENVYGKQD